MLTYTNSLKVVGIEGRPVTVECDTTPGIGIHLVGLADNAVKESLLRTITALQANGFRIPGKKLVINLAPADLHKSGSGYDLPVALCIISSSEQGLCTPEELTSLKESLFFGELGLDGSLRSVPGAVQAYFTATEKGLSRLILPYKDALDLNRCFNLAVNDPEHVKVYGVNNISEAIRALRDEIPTIDKVEATKEPKKDSHRQSDRYESPVLNESARRAAEIAAAGGHHMLVIGAPGSGKTIVAGAVRELLPLKSFEEFITMAKVYSASDRLGLIDPGERPFRAPHYSSSLAALLGGGQGDGIVPGEISLASGGVLYLDEFNCLPKSVKEALRGPLEDKKAIISRLKSKVEIPAQFQLICSMNPCPCGYYGEGDKCTCTPAQKTAYLASSLNTAIYDHLDIQLMTRTTPESKQAESVPLLTEAKERVRKARYAQEQRNPGRKLNADLSFVEAQDACRLQDNTRELIETLITRLGLSARAYSRMLKIARTIADLEGHDAVTNADLAEAASYRFLDRTIPLDDAEKNK